MVRNTPRLGWGACFAEESGDLKQKFEVEYGGDEARSYKHCLQGFRWTCRGTDASIKYGCDHHGTGLKPCTCDYCRCVWVSFLPLLWSLSFCQGRENHYPIASTRNRSQSRHGLNLSIVNKLEVKPVSAFILAIRAVLFQPFFSFQL